MKMSKLPTGIPGFDLISLGGLPEGRSTLLTGTSGSAKTVFACQFLIEGIRLDSFWVGPFRVAQLASLVGVVVAVVGLAWTRHRAQRGLSGRVSTSRT